MPEPQARRDQREIVVPVRPQGTAGDSRDVRPGARRRLIGSPAAPVGWFAILCATATETGRLALRRPGTAFGTLLAVGAVAVVSMNALGYQMGRHPAPIFPKVAARPAIAAKTVTGKAGADTAPKAEAVKSEGGRPDVAKSEAMKSEAAKSEAAKFEATKGDPTKADGVRVEALRPRRGDDIRSDPAARDTIGDIIRAGETTASVTPKTDPTIARAQRALVKLGYGPLKADGMLGAGTRAAIERFERDRRLPVKGEPAGRTMRELVARAGIPQG